MSVESIVRQAFPWVDPNAAAAAVWALLHGSAFLRLDGKLDASSPGAVAATVNSAVYAVPGAVASHN